MMELMNAALISQGFDDTLSENDGTDEWRLLSRNWPTVVEAELEDGAYSFTKETADLQTRSAGGYGYADAYLVPLVALHVRSLWVVQQERRQKIDWVQDGTKVHTNAAAGVFIEYAASADPSLWSANFSRGVQMKLEAILLRFKEEYSSAGAMEQQAEMHFQRARTNSSKARSAQEPYRPSRFAIARFNRA